MGIPSVNVIGRFNQITFFDALRANTHLNQIYTHVVDSMHHTGMRVWISIISRSEIAVCIDLQHTYRWVFLGIGLHKTVGYGVFRAKRNHEFV